MGPILRSRARQIRSQDPYAPSQIRVRQEQAKAVTNKAPMCPHRSPKYPDVTKVMQSKMYIHENRE